VPSEPPRQRCSEQPNLDDDSSSSESGDGNDSSESGDSDDSGENDDSSSSNSSSSGNEDASEGKGPAGTSTPRKKSATNAAIDSSSVDATTPISRKTQPPVSATKNNNDGDDLNAPTTPVSTSPFPF